MNNLELRNIEIIKDFTIHAEGSVLICFGNTKVLVNATIDNKVPSWLKGQKKGWITAEYEMLPRSTHTRMSRESRKGKVSGRTHEISRLIGRSLRSCIDLELLGERQILIDCDVIQADGGTRTASITGAYIALKLAVDKLLESGELTENPIISQVAAISVGKVNEELVLDLDYIQDSSASVDMNVVMNSNLELIEIQGTGEEATFTRKELNELLDLAEKGITHLLELQKEF